MLQVFAPVCRLLNRQTMQNDYQKEKLALRRKLRSNPTNAKMLMWRVLRKKQTGFRFRRQHPIGRYIVDFYCPEVRLVIEVDGDVHSLEASVEYDEIRDEFIRAQDYEILRVTNNEVLTNMSMVFALIKDICEERKLQFKRTPPQPSPVLTTDMVYTLSGTWFKHVKGDNGTP